MPLGSTTAPHLLVGMAAVYAKAHMQLHRLIKFGFLPSGSTGPREPPLLSYSFRTVDKLLAVNVMFPLLHSFLLWYIGIFLPLMAGRCYSVTEPMPASAGNHADRCIQAGSVQIGHFRGGDLFQLFA